MQNVDIENRSQMGARKTSNEEQKAEDIGGKSRFSTTLHNFESWSQIKEASSSPNVHR